MQLLVVTPTLGRSLWLAETVASVEACAPGAIHVLVGPSEARADLDRRFPRTRFVVEPGGGMYAAINAGAAAVSGWEAITYLNDDDLLLPGFAAIVRSLARGNLSGAPLMVYGRVRLVDASGRRLGAIPVSRCPRVNRLLYALRLEPVYQHGTVLTRAAWEKLGGFDRAFRVCGDSELLARACVTGVPAVFVRAPVAAFRLRPGQLTKQRAAMVAERIAVDDKLGLVAEHPGARHRLAGLVFRLTNLPVYAERVARFGFKTFDEVLESGGRESAGPNDHA